MPLSANKRLKSATRLPWMSETPVRFLVFGLINTVGTFGVFVAVGLLVHPSIAYGVGFLLGILIVYIFSNKWVFRGKSSRTANISYLLWYLAVFALGQGIITLAHPSGLKELLLVSGLLIGITLPLTYIGGKWIFRR